MRNNVDWRSVLVLAVVCTVGPGAQEGHAKAMFPEKGKMATAKMQGCEDPNITGTATLMEEVTPEGIKQVEVSIEVKGLKDGTHAWHIHETAACQPCSAAKGHHDPGPFGKSAPDAPDFNHPFHMGDLVNIEVENGVGKARTTTNRITLSDGRLSIFDGDGSSFIIHTYEDTYCDQEDELKPGCAGGPRDACGIIEPVKSAGP